MASWPETQIRPNSGRGGKRCVGDLLEIEIMTAEMASNWNSEDILWSNESFSPRHLVEKFRNDLPMIVLVTRGVYGHCEEQSLGSEQILRIQDWGEQNRVLAKNTRGHHMSIPLDYPMQCVVSGEQDGSPQFLADVTQLMDFPFRVTFLAPPDGGVFFRGTSPSPHGNDLQLGELELLKSYKECYLKANAIVNSKLLIDTVLVLPMYVDILLARADGMKDKSGEEWLHLQAHFSQLVSSLDFKSVQGNMDIMVYKDKYPTGDYDSVQPEEYIRHTSILGLPSPPSHPPPSTSPDVIYEDPDVLLNSDIKPRIPPRVPISGRRGSSSVEPSGGGRESRSLTLNKENKRRTSRSVGPEGRMCHYPPPDLPDTSEENSKAKQQTRSRTYSRSRHSPITGGKGDLESILTAIIGNSPSSPPPIPNTPRPPIQQHPKSSPSSSAYSTSPSNQFLYSSATLGHPRRKNGSRGRHPTLPEIKYSVGSSDNDPQYVQHSSIPKLPAKIVSKSENNLLNVLGDGYDHYANRSTLAPQMDANYDIDYIVPSSLYPVGSMLGGDGNFRAQGGCRMVEAERGRRPSVSEGQDWYGGGGGSVGGGDTYDHLPPSSPSATSGLRMGVFASSWGSSCEPPYFNSLKEVPRDVRNLDVQQVAQCLRMLNLGQYVDVMVDGQIDGALLMTLNSEDLQDTFKMNKVEAKKLVFFARDGWRPKMGKAPFSDSAFSDQISL